ncbi:hypothetical protein DFH29DRAFT_999085 [Suillus ampliporus]|nr:hypothetical protein DFH29DRAFT_999085 [Suillus ampliporus]
MFSHTDALQLLPSFYADSPSTPGITALAHLGYRIDPTLFGTDDAPSNINCPFLPLELWQQIALYLHPSDLVTLGLVSKLCREAASMVLCYPFICGYCLVAVPKEKPESLLDNYISLHAAAFSAVHTGIPAIVLVGLRNKPEDVVNVPLRVGSFSLSVAFSVEA